MKKIISVVLSLAVLTGLLAGCGVESIPAAGNADRLNIVTTIFPEYDWVREIMGEKAESADITMLLDNGVDLHSYQPTADDIVKISDCDLFIYVGGESDGWVDDALKEATNKDMKVINLLDVLGDSVKAEETVEGMQETEHAHEHGHGHSHDEDITEDDIQDRTLDDFAGAWKSLYPYLLNGDLDEYCEHKADEDEDSTATRETYLEKYKVSWQCNAEKIVVDGNKITFTDADGKTVSAEYAYAGYQPKQNDEGEISSVRYQFETDSEDAPKYVQFNDHGYKPGEAGHFHIYFGNDGFDKLMDSKTNPFFVKDALSVDGILDELMGHEHGNDHGKEVSDFEDSEVQDRALSDWEGDWQSAYPFALDGTLDDAFVAMAESGEMTADEYKAYYQAGYKTDISSVNIDGNHIKFTYEDGRQVGSDYKYVGYYIQNWSTGTKAAMYRFEAVDHKSGAPIYVEFNDHMIESAAAEHFHLRMSNESFDAIVDPENSWPTFFPADMAGEEICEHMEGHDHDEEEAHNHRHGEEADEHVWLSLKNAQVLCGSISAALQEIDPDNKGTYAANASAYIQKLSTLDGEYKKAVGAATYKTVLFGDRFPFRYLVDDYGLDYYAAFVGCSAETEASFETISFLSNKVDELKLPCVLTIEGTQHKIAETIMQNTTEKNQKVLTMDSMQSTTSDDVKNGATYLSVMEDNLAVLKEALN